MERFVIKKRDGKQRAAIATHEYCKERKRTRTIYLGTLSLDLDPAVLANDFSDIGEAINIKAGAIADGRPFVLDEEVRRQLVAWLEVHGNVARRANEEKRARAAALAQAKARRRAIESELRTQIENEIRQTLSVELDALKVSPLRAAELALDAACEAIAAEAAAHRAAGHELSRMRGSVGENLRPNPLDELRLVSEHLRKACFERFETACKQAGLMSTRGTS